MPTGEGQGQMEGRSEVSSRSAVLLERLGLGGGPADARFNRRLILALVFGYAISFALFYPCTITNTDEAEYIDQARLLIEGRSSITLEHPLTGETREIWPSTRPLGTALLMAPFVWVAGWQAAFVVPCLSLLAVVLLTAGWLREERRPPFLALILFGFPAALVMGRVAMSDVPSAAVSALGLWLFWRGIGRGPGCWLASGFVAGASVIF